MNPTLKKVLAAIAVKQGIDKIQEMRRPKPSLASRLTPFVVVGAAGAATYYLAKSGRLQPLVDKVKGNGQSSGHELGYAPQPSHNTVEAGTQ